MIVIVLNLPSVVVSMKKRATAKSYWADPDRNSGGESANNINYLSSIDSSLDGAFQLLMIVIY